MPLKVINYANLLHKSWFRLACLMAYKTAESVAASASHIPNTHTQTDMMTKEVK